VAGSRPPGSTSPNSTCAIAVPPSSPGYHASSSPAIPARHGVSTGAPVSSTTTVRLLAAATAEISESWSPQATCAFWGSSGGIVLSIVGAQCGVSDMHDLSSPSLSESPATTIATPARCAAATAEDTSLPSL